MRNSAALIRALSLTKVLMPISAWRLVLGRSPKLKPVVGVAYDSSLSVGVS